MIQLGYVLYSARVVEGMFANHRFAEWVGRCLHRHLNGDTGELRPSWSPNDGTRRSRYLDLWGTVVVATELDKNSMPRTSVVFAEEGGCL